MSSNEQALKELKVLVEVPGALRHITSEHACGAGTHEAAPGFDKAVCDAFKYPLNNYRHFVIHDVTSIEGPDARGRVMALTDFKGDGRYGYPADVLRALRETVE